MKVCELRFSGHTDKNSMITCLANAGYKVSLIDKKKYPEKTYNDETYQMILVEDMSKGITTFGELNDSLEMASNFMGLYTSK